MSCLPSRSFLVTLTALLALGASAQGRAQTLLDYCPTAREVVLNTNFTQITPKNSPPINVAGGVFTFRNVTINSGVLVRGEGTNPMIWVVFGDFIVDGALNVDGGDGERVNTLNSPNFPSFGGPGNCSGGNGGRGSPNAVGQSLTGESGFGPGQVPAFGGGPGLLGLLPGCGRGSGGGGGTFTTAGDPHYKVKAAGTSFVQQLGFGGFGCLGVSGAPTRILPGGQPGNTVFVDNRDDNDFFGNAVNVQQLAFVNGELPFPIGGSGGGGGGDRAQQLGNQNWLRDNKGGGGGGGGGVLIIVALGKIEVSGLISANGGHGGGGEQAGSNNQGAGGGGGSGGMVLLYLRKEIVLHTRGETYARNDYDFSLSADGGIGLQGRFAGVEIGAKYPPPLTGAQWDDNPTGAMGGMGIVQLFSPAGQNVDGTNTILDDNIKILGGNGQALTGTEKIRYLGWRGFPNAQGVWVDDSNNPTYNNAPSTPGYPAWASSPDDEGDIRPAPVLLPVF